jgi:hypothetical protein
VTVVAALRCFLCFTFTAVAVDSARDVWRCTRCGIERRFDAEGEEF